MLKFSRSKFAVGGPDTSKSVNMTRISPFSTKFWFTTTYTKTGFTRH